MKSGQVVGVALILGLATWHLLANWTRKLPAVALTRLLPWASQGPLRAAPEELGKDSAGPFRGQGWSPVSAQSIYLTTQAEGGELKFYLTQRAPLKLNLDARGSGECQMLLNGMPLAPLNLSSQWQEFPLELPEGQLQEGVNRLSLRGNPAIDCRSLKAAVDFAPLEGSPDEIGLALNQSLEICVELRPGSVLAWEDLEPWTLPGAPALDVKNLLLEVRLRSGLARLQAQQSQDCRPGPTQLRLNLEQPAAVELSLLLRNRTDQTSSQPGKPTPHSSGLPGQLGIKLIKPSLTQARPPEAPFAPTPLPVSAAPPSPPPLIVLYVIDTLRPDHLGCYGYPRKTSPHLDEFARDSVLFRQALASTSWTKPSTATILTGLEPSQHGAIDFGDRLNPSVETLAEVLRKAGYQTRAAVTNPFVSESFGFDQGFDSYKTLTLGSAEQVTDQGLSWLKQKQGPQFLYLHTLDPHSPYRPPPDLIPVGSRRRSFEDAELLSLAAELRKQPKPTRQALARIQEVLDFYDAEIQANDRAFGRLIQGLKQADLYRDSLIIVISDHGEEFFEHGGFGHISSLHNEQLKIPLLIKFPGLRWKGLESKGPWQQLDIVPTVLASLGQRPPPSAGGCAFDPSLDEQVEHRPVFFSLCAGQDSAKFGQGENRMLILEGVQWDSFSLQQTLASRDFGRPLWQLFDQAQDPGQQNNLAYGVPEVRSKLNALLRQHRKPTTRRYQASPEAVRRSLQSLPYLR